MDNASGAQSGPLVPPNARAHFRNNIFAAAVLKCRAGQCAVRVRNVSRAGAMIEAAISLPVGAQTTLVKGNVEVSGHVAWSIGHRAGVVFSSPVNPEEWVSSRHNHQQHVADAIISRIRSGENDKLDEISEPSAGIPTDKDVALAISRLLREVLNRLADAPELVARYASELQSLEIALEATSAIVSSSASNDGPAFSRVAAACNEAMRGLQER